MRAHRWYTPWLLVTPAVVWVLVFAFWPFLNTVALAFTNARPLRTPEFVGLANFAELLTDDRFGFAVITGLVYVAVCVPLLTFLPLLVALLVARKVPGITVFRTTYYFPVIASVVVVGIIWQWMFDSAGLISQLVQAVGLSEAPISLLVSRWGLIFVAISLTVWKGIGYYMVVYLAALANVPRDLHEAAALDGAGAWSRFWSVTVPSVRGAMLLVAALIAVSAMRTFTEIYVLSNGTGGPGGEAMTLVMMIQSVGRGLNGEIGYASAASVVLFFLTVGPLLLIAFLNNRGAARPKIKTASGAE